MFSLVLRMILASFSLYVLLTVHLGIIFVNNQLDAEFFPCTYISILYMFRTAVCPSPGELIVSIRHLVYVTLKKSGQSKIIKRYALK